MKKRLFDKSDLEAIEAKIREIETTTSGEIVVTTVRRSSAYRWIRWFYAAIGWASASVAFAWYAHQRHWGDTASPEIFLFDLLIAQALAALVCFWLPLRLILPRRAKAFAVQREARLAFLAANLSHTEKESGVLVFLSELEHRVEILADRGVHRVLGDAYWKARAEAIAQSIRNGRAREGLLAVLDQLGKDLARHFPASRGNPNELPDTVRTE